MNWQIKSLDEVCTKITDGAHQSPKTVDSGKPMASVKDLTRFGVDLSEARKISIEDFERLVKQGCQPQVGDVLIAKDGNSALDTVCNIKQPLDAVLLSSVAILRPNLNVLDSDFLKYYLSSKDVVDYFKSNFISGAAIPRVVLRDFRKAQIHLPELKIQKRIAKILSTLDDKIHLNDQLNQTLESIAQAIFKSWFIDFEPVRAKIAAKQEGKDPELAAMCAISGKSEAELEQMASDDFAELQATAALFPDELVESELGEVPRGWSTVNIGSLIDLTIGGDWGKEVKDEKYNVQARVIRGTDIPSIKGGSDEQVPSRYIDSKKLRTRELKLGDIVIEVSGGSPKQPTGRTIYISNEILLRLKDPVIPASFCRLLRPNSHELGVFLSIYLQKIYVEGKTWLYQNQSTGISNFQTTVFLEKEILTLPPLILLEEFEKIITPIIKKIDSSERLFLSNLRDTLLPKLLSGEVDVSGLQGEGIDG